MDECARSLRFTRHRLVRTYALIIVTELVWHTDDRPPSIDIFSVWVRPPPICTLTRRAGHLALNQPLPG